MTPTRTARPRHTPQGVPHPPPMMHGVAGVEALSDIGVLHVERRRMRLVEPYRECHGGIIGRPAGLLSRPCSAESGWFGDVSVLV